MRRTSILLALALVVGSSPSAQAGLFHRRGCRPRCHRCHRCEPCPRPCGPVRVTTCVTTETIAWPQLQAPAPAVMPPAPAKALPAIQGAAAAGVPGDFLAWLNALRARYGLAPVGYDANLASWAAANSAQQSARGLGHFVMGPARRQNSAMGSGSSIGAQWLASAPHRAALLDPSIRFVGLAGHGAYWTANFR